MNIRKATMGKRIGACFLDGLFIWVIILAIMAVNYGQGILAMFVTSTLYYGFFEGSRMHASPGKYLCGLKVVDLQGMPLSYRKSFLRSFCKLLSGAILYIGYLMGFFDECGRTLHDRLVGTLVVENHSQTSNGYSQELTPKVIGTMGELAGQSFLVSLQGTIIGRDANACDIIFLGEQASQSISRVHCKIQFQPQTQMFILSDLGSSYGTFKKNGTRIQQGNPVALHSGDEFYLANRAAAFQVSIR